MPSRKSLGNGLLGALVLTTAILTVGLTASSESAFSITLRPVFLKLGLDIDVKLGTVHFHSHWTLLPEAPSDAGPSTKPGAARF